jgi:hypothetical protein
MVVVAPDGRVLLWSSWHHRRGLGLLESATGRRLHTAPSDATRRSYRIGASFAVGSALFAVGSFAPTATVLAHWGLWVFFLGSIFFTTAAYLQFHEAANAGDDIEGASRTHRPVRWRAESIGWWATAVQLLGTVAFNISTVAAIFATTWSGEVVLVWSPDAVGSICFLVASGLALAETCGRWCCRRLRSVAWWVASVNLAGSVAFGVSAVAARILPDALAANPALANGTTFLGAACFLLGAVLLPVAVVRDEPDTAPVGAAPVGDDPAPGRSRRRRG